MKTDVEIVGKKKIYMFKIKREKRLGTGTRWTNTHRFNQTHPDESHSCGFIDDLAVSYGALPWAETHSSWNLGWQHEHLGETLGQNGRDALTDGSPVSHSWTRIFSALEIHNMTANYCLLSPLCSPPAVCALTCVVRQRGRGRRWTDREGGRRCGRWAMMLRVDNSHLVTDYFAANTRAFSLKHEPQPARGQKYH